VLESPSTSRDDHFLRTERIGFRLWRAEDLPSAAGLWGDPEVTRFVGGPLSTEAVEKRLAAEIASQEAHGVQYWPLFLLATGEHLGCCGLHPYPSPERTLELGFHLRPAFWRRGLAREAAQAVIRHAFTDLGADLLFAGHHPGNSASRALLESLGFRYVRDELYPPTGLLHPSYLLRRVDGDEPVMVDEGRHEGIPDEPGTCR